ncbi:MAG: NAD(P)-dependent oxidoreductase [Planctomycetes bacterium]|nr:NAD(P)-dependent oxidoreductase [Planctomycetota bacterium]
MNVAVTGATGFLGRYIVNHLLNRGDRCRCWHRPDSDRGGFIESNDRIEWVTGELSQRDTLGPLVDGMDAVVHSALYRPGAGFRGSEGDVEEFVEKNVLGTIALIQAARQAGVPRFVFISTCAVHEVILDDRPLDEAHPLWATSHYGAHKAAIEKFIHSYGLGEGYDICALRPTGIYGVARPIAGSKWYHLVRDVADGKSMNVDRGGKEVHAGDVAKAVGILLGAEGTAGQAYNCYDRYVGEYEVACLAKEISGSDAVIDGRTRTPKHQIETAKLRALGMEFGGEAMLRKTVEQMLTE